MIMILISSLQITCPQDAYESGTTCICLNTDRQFANGNCNKCASGFFKLNTVCKACPQGQNQVTTDETKCTCPDSSSFSVENGVGICLCANGFGLQNGACVSCPTAQAVAGHCLCADRSFNWTADATCKTKTTCLDTQILNDYDQCETCNAATPDATRKTCVCASKQQSYVQGACAYKTCPNANEFVSKITGECKSCPAQATANHLSCECAANQVFSDQETCTCDLYSISHNGQCIKCPGNAPADNNKCVCDVTGAVFNPDTKVCGCQSNQFVSSNTCTTCPAGSLPSKDLTKCECSGENFELKNDVCVCQAGFFTKANQCLKCAENSISLADRSGCDCGNVAWNIDSNVCNVKTGGISGGAIAGIIISIVIVMGVVGILVAKILKQKVDQRQQLAEGDEMSSTSSTKLTDNKLLIAGSNYV
ncbi:Conserved_hypothetical protein [Hexamita inflata]|uniref:Cysteine-rich membrane protein 2 n=1 Tax=Hexamita inflata TaxID=28002 RepID=A0ABP1H6U5_9EUKA